MISGEVSCLGADLGIMLYQVLTGTRMDALEKSTKGACLHGSVSLIVTPL